jgi:hypothetical protein
MWRRCRFFISGQIANTIIKYHSEINEMAAKLFAITEALQANNAECCPLGLILFAFPSMPKDINMNCMPFAGQTDERLIVYLYTISSSRRRPRMQMN